MLIIFYRGAEPATVYSLNFSNQSSFLLCTSSRKTVHVFDTRSILPKSYAPFEVYTIKNHLSRQESAKISGDFSLSGKFFSAISSVKSALKLGDGKFEMLRVGYLKYVVRYQHRDVQIDKIF